MQVTDEDMPNTLHFKIILPELHLGAFTTIYQIKNAHLHLVNERLDFYLLLV